MAERRYRDAEVELRGGYEIVAKQLDPSVSWLAKARLDLVTVYAALKQPERVHEFQAEIATVAAKTRVTR